MNADRNSSIRSHVAALIAARVVAGGISAVTAVLLPRALHHQAYGQYGIAVGLAGMLVVLSDLGITTSFARYLAEGSVDRGTMRKVGVWRIASSIIAALGLVAFGGAIQLGFTGSGSSSDMVPAFMYLSGLLVLSNSIFGVANGLLPTMRMMRIQLAITIGQPIIELVGMIAALQFAFGARGVIVASTAAALTMGSIGLLLIYRTLPKTGAKISARSVGQYSMPMFVVVVCFSVFGQIDQLIIWAFHGSVVAAGYIASWKLITLLHLPGLAVGTVVAPRLVGAGENGRAMYLKWLSVLAVVYGGITAVSIAIAPVLIPFALGDDWSKTTPVFVSLSLYAFLLGIAPHVTMAANFLGGAAKRVKLSVITIVLNLVLDLALVPSMGVYGAAIGTSVAFGWYVSAHALLSLRLLDARQSDSQAKRGSPWKVIVGVLWFAGAMLLTAEAVRIVTFQLDGNIPTIVEVLVASFIGVTVYAAAAGVYWLLTGGTDLKDAPPGESVVPLARDADERGAA